MKSPSPSVHRDVVHQALVRGRQRIGCFAAAFIARRTQGPDSSIYFDYAEGQDSSHARRLIERSADSFFDVCKEERRPVLRNRVRSATNGPLLGRFVIAPVRESGGVLAGIFVLYNQADGIEFTDKDVQMAERWSRVFVKAVALPRDPLTKLLTPSAFARTVEKQRGALVEGAPAALIYGNIDQLHHINDLWGLSIGDAAIALVGKELLEIANATDAAACRLSGDRFAVFVPDCTIERARELAEQMRKAVADIRFASNEQPIEVSMSLGVARLTGGEISLDHGLAAAESACKAAKERGRNRSEVHQDSDLSMIRRSDDLLGVVRLRAALDEGRLRVFAQPIAQLLRGETTRRFEMLVRLIDEKERVVLPQQFISSATRFQLLPQLDRHVIEYVLTKLGEAKLQPGFLPVQVSINLSGPTLAEPEFADWLVDCIKKRDVPAAWLAFEISENAAVANFGPMQALIQRLAPLGCRFALDNFGTGSNSLAYLQSLKLDTIKIDGAFIRDLLENERSESLVRGIALLASALKIEIVAECVETPMLGMRLVELGVQYGQGFALGRPLPLERILDPSTALALAS